MQTFYDHEMTTVAMTNHVVAVLIMFTNLPKKSWFSSFWPHSDLEIWSRPPKLVWKWKSQWSFFSCPVWKISFKHSLRKSQCYDVLAKSESVNYLSLHTYWSCEKPSLFLLFFFLHDHVYVKQPHKVWISGNKNLPRKCNLRFGLFNKFVVLPSQHPDGLYTGSRPLKLVWKGKG